MQTLPSRGTLSPSILSRCAAWLAIPPSRAQASGDLSPSDRLPVRDEADTGEHSAVSRGGWPGGGLGQDWIGADRGVRNSMPGSGVTWSGSLRPVARAGPHLNRLRMAVATRRVARDRL